jgi:hypothetical protein
VRSKNGAGVVGSGTAVGVRGAASNGPGGWFQGSREPFRAQIHLEPQPMDTPREVPINFLETYLKQDEVTELPKVGTIGDLLVTSKTLTGNIVSYFCGCALEAPLKATRARLSGDRSC